LKFNAGPVTGTYYYKDEMMRNYWSCGKFADWIRGTAKPTAETSKGWRVWNEQARTSHPIRYWIVEEGLDRLQSIIYGPVEMLHSIKYYINNRWVTRTHALTAHPRDIKPGQWQDVGYRFLPCLFNELVDFVEVELAWWHIVWADKADIAKYNPPFWARGWWRWRTWRCRQAGLDNLEWQRNLRHDEDWIGADDPLYGKLTPQAEKAQEILELYMWWTLGRVLRVDPHDASGWTAYCERRRKDGTDFFEDRDEADREESRRILDECRRLEEKYEQEDEDMMIRLIKIRQGLWT
jgi:hypothetical protein